MKWTDPIRDFAHSMNIQSAPRERGGHEKKRKPLLSLRERPLKYGFDASLAIRLILAALLFSAALVLHVSDALKVFLLALSALIAGYDLILDSILRVVRLRQYDERILVFLAALLAFIFVEPYEGAAVMLLYQFGILIKRIAAGGVRNTVQAPLQVQARQVNVLRGGNEYTVGAHDVSRGETIVVDPGETVAFDSIVLKGGSSVDMSALTGEDAPVHVEAGDALLAGCRNLDAVLYVEVCTRAGESAAEKILKLIRQDQEGRGPLEKRLSAFCSWYTPIMALAAVLYAVLLPMATQISYAESIRRALILLLIAGSASFTLALPVLYHCAIGNAAKHGIVFKTKAAVDRAAATDRLVFDQSGTLTHGRLRVSSVKAAKYDPETMLKIAAHAAAYSEQTLAKAIVASYTGTIYIELIGAFQECGNEGVCVTVDGVEIVIGSNTLLQSKGISIPAQDLSSELVWYLGIAGIYTGRILFADDVKEESEKTLRALSAERCSVTLLTESAGSENENNFRRIGLTDIYFANNDVEKAKVLQTLQSGEGRGRQLLFVDSAKRQSEMRESDCLRMTMNCLSGNSVSENADILILSEKPIKVPETLKHAKIVKLLTIENLFIVFIIKCALIIAAFLGKDLIWITVLISMIADLLTILQVYRIRKMQTSIND